MRKKMSAGDIYEKLEDFYKQLSTIGNTRASTTGKFE